MNPHRINRLIDEVISKLNLDLTGLNVLTELGSGNFLFTPLIAQKAGASKVFVWTNDTLNFGSAKENINQFKKLLHDLETSESVFEFSANKRPNGAIEQSDIVTNLGHIRPINEAFISQMKQDAVIAYMSESWEFREGDIDLSSCKEKGIKVAGTWENFPELMVFEAVGTLAIKLLLEAGVEVFQNKIAVLGKDNFSKTIESALFKIGADVEVFQHANELERIDKFDAILLADYTSVKRLIDASYAEDRPNEFPVLVHLCGHLKTEEWPNEVKIYPAKDGSNHKMTETLAYLGPRYVIDLHAAGLKVGQLLKRNEKSDLVQPMA